MAAGQIVFVRAALASGVLNIMLAVVLAPRWGLIGIALAIAISQLLTNNWYAPYITIRFFGVRIAVLVREVWLPMIVLLGGQLVANFGLRRLPWLGTLSLAAVVANFGVASCLGAGMWWLVVADSRERARVLERLLGWSRVRAERA
jgi:hypothetical protein